MFICNMLCQLSLSFTQSYLNLYLRVPVMWLHSHVGTKAPFCGIQTDTVSIIYHLCALLKMHYVVAFLSPSNFISCISLYLALRF